MLTREESLYGYGKVMRSKDVEVMRMLARTDLFFLMVVVCGREDMNRDWIYDRCREVEAEPDGRVDLWFRGGWKSSLITMGLTVKDILTTHGDGAVGEEVTVGIFSHTRPIAKAFLIQIKREFESNEFLKDLFPDVLYKKPWVESPRWSDDGGIIVKRKSNPKESTIEAWGLVDGQPTSRHYKLMVYDDVVTRESVTTPDQISKTTEAFGLSMNLSSENYKRRIIGTRYHSVDTYHYIIQNKIAIPRIHPATDDGTFDGTPVIWTKEEFDRKVREQGRIVAASQLLQNPLADNMMGFRTDWLKRYFNLDKQMGWNYYIMVDAASEKKKTSDYTAIAVVGLGTDGNYYLVDGIRDRMNLTERTKALFRMVKKWNPKKVGYEKYGKDSDIEHIEHVMEQENYRFNITQLKGSMPKNDRIRRLIPLFEEGRFYLPQRLIFVNVLGQAVDLMHEFITKEYETFPVSEHDDFCLTCHTLIATANGWKKIVDIRQGEMVWTRQGLKKVIWAGKTGVKKVITRFGLIGTPNHPVWTENRGWIELQSLLPSDVLVCLEKQFYGMEESIIGTQTQKEGILSDTKRDYLSSTNENVGIVPKFFQVRATSLDIVVKNADTHQKFQCSENIVPVYNLKVDGANEYFANNILVHNCDAMSRIMDSDLGAVFPKEGVKGKRREIDYDPLKRDKNWENDDKFYTAPTMTFREFITKKR